ncbi:MAG: hypothetical protein WC375_06985 [Methanomassiliicoccales archaeon]|jgi:hypothetical protein
MANPWERREGETSKAYAAFCFYRDLGPDRSVPKALEACGKPIGSLSWWQLWSRTNDWVERSAAYDDHENEIIRKRLEAKRMAAIEKQAELAEAMLKKVKDRVDTIELAFPSDVAKWADVGTKMQRLALGEPTEIGKQQLIIPNILEVTLNDGDSEAKPASRTDKGVA